MLRLDRVIKPWREADALNAQINLFGFWNETAFLTKSGDLGMVLRVSGIDYESLDNSEQDYAVKRLESAFKGFGTGFHVYQYLFKSNRPKIPFATYGDPLIDAAIDQRREFFRSKRDRLYQIEIFYVILLEGTRSRPGLLATLGKVPSDPKGALQELKARFSSNATKRLLRSEIDADLVKLTQRAENFSRQLADLVAIETQGREASLTFFRRLVNFDDWRIAGKPRADQFLDYQVVNSDIEAERDHLRVGDHTVRVLTMKEAIAETRPLVLDQLFKIPANFYVVTEWTPLSMAKARKEVTLSFARFQTFNFGGWEKTTEALEPLLFYVLHRASDQITAPAALGTFKTFLMDEAWLFFKNQTIRNYIVEAEKTWRKHNAAMILATQSIKELQSSGLLEIVAESCPTKIFFANPEMDRAVYAEAFHLNDTELDLIADLAPPGQMLIRKAQSSKKVQLNVDSVSYWMATNNAPDNLKKRDYFARYGVAEGIRQLAIDYPFEPRRRGKTAPAFQPLTSSR